MKESEEEEPSSIITVSYIQTQNLNIPVGISKIPEEGVWPCACVCLLGNIWIDSATVQWRCPAETLLPRQGFVTSVRSAVGGLSRLNLDPGSQHRLTSPLPPVTDVASCDWWPVKWTILHCAVGTSGRFEPSSWVKMEGGHLDAVPCVSLRATLWHSSCGPLVGPPNRTTIITQCYCLISLLCSIGTTWGPVSHPHPPSVWRHSHFLTKSKLWGFSSINLSIYVKEQPQKSVSGF